MVTHIKGLFQPFHLAAINYSYVTYPSCVISIFRTHGLLGLFSRWLATVLPETFLCYSRSKPGLYKLTAQYFHARGTRLTYITQELCQFGDRLHVWNSQASFPACFMCICVIQTSGWWIWKMEANFIQPYTTTSNDQKPRKTQTSCCLFVDLGYAVYPSAIYPLSCLWTNSVGIKWFSKYEGVMYKASTPYYLCLFVEYDDSAVGYVGVPSSSFNANVSLKQNLKEIVPQDYWGYLEEKYGFRFVNSL